MSKNTNTLHLNTSMNKWKDAIDFVDYPVHIVPLLFNNPVTNDLERATGNTQAGRDNEHFGVAVDRYKDGNFGIIATVTDTYGTLSTPEVYKELYEELVVSQNQQAYPERVYVSSNGGVQKLHIKVDGMKSPALNHIDMMITLVTSVDGTKRHHMILTAYDNIKKEQLIGVGMNTMNLSARHTKSIGEKHIAFSNVIESMVESWNEDIIPMLSLMNDMKFDYNVALEILQNIMESAKIPASHTKRALTYCSTGISQDSSLLSIVSGMSSYMNGALADRPERLDFFQGALSKEVNRVFNMHKK